MNAGQSLCNKNRTVRSKGARVFGVHILVPSIAVLAKTVRGTRGIHEGANFLLLKIGVRGGIQLSVPSVESRVAKESVSGPPMPMSHCVLAGLPQLRPTQLLSRRPTNFLQLKIKLQPFDKNIRRDFINPAYRYDLGQGQLLLPVLAARQVALVQRLGERLRECPDVFEGEPSTLAKRSEIVPEGDVTRNGHSIRNLCAVPDPSLAIAWQAIVPKEYDSESGEHNASTLAVL